MAKKSRTPKLKKGAWFYQTRGSYLPATPEGWLMHVLLLFAGVMVISLALDDTRSMLVVGVTMLLQLIGLAALFSVIAARKS